MAWVDRYLEYERSGEGYAALVAELEAAKGEEWAQKLGVHDVYPTPEQQPKWAWVATYDPAADIRQIRFPVLLLFADRDESSPSEASLARWRENLAAGGNRKVEWKMFKNAEHHFLTPPHTEGWPTLAPGYYETQISWLRRVVPSGYRRSNETKR
jgi:pimeloyl-ACP methyl ester carboxylesterase